MMVNLNVPDYCEMEIRMYEYTRRAVLRIIRSSLSDCDLECLVCSNPGYNDLGGSFYNKRNSSFE